MEDRKNALDGNNVRTCDRENISIKHFNYCVNQKIHNNVWDDRPFYRVDLFKVQRLLQ